MKKAGLYKKMRRVAVIPIVLLVIAITVYSYVRFSNTMYDEAGDNMRIISHIVTSAYDVSYPGDYNLRASGDDKYDLYKGETLITEDYSIIDDISGASGIDISLLYMDMRIHTTFATDSGTRLAGICTNAETAEMVLNEGKEAFYKSITIAGDKYLVLYVPLKNSDGSIIGMVETARKMDALKRSVLLAVWPILLLAVLGMIVALFFTYKSMIEITGVLRKLQIFLNNVSSGNLQTEIDSELTKREDELGDISKSSVRMQRSIRTFVETDPLTGLNNRRYVSSAVARIAEKQKETGMPFCIAISDIDFFKKVNDTYGHNAGDEVLKAVAKILKSNMQGRGFAARWGGEEFVLVFDKCDSADGAKTLESILDQIRDMTVETEGYSIKITMTFGIVDSDGTDIEKMVEKADEKLYYGKTHGRNQVVLNIEEKDAEESN